MASANHQAPMCNRASECSLSHPTNRQERELPGSVLVMALLRGNVMHGVPTKLLEVVPSHRQIRKSWHNAIEWDGSTPGRGAFAAL